MGLTFRRLRWLTATMWKMRLLRTPCMAILRRTAMMRGGRKQQKGVEVGDSTWRRNSKRSRASHHGHVSKRPRQKVRNCRGHEPFTLRDEKGNRPVLSRLSPTNTTTTWRLKSSRSVRSWLSSIDLLS